MVATRRDLDDPVTVRQVARTVGGRALLELLHALAIADGLATGPAAWNDWKAALVADLVGGWRPCWPASRCRRPRRCARTSWRWPPTAAPPPGSAGTEVTVVAPDRPGLLWRAAGVLASHRLTVRGANASSVGRTAVSVFDVGPSTASRRMRPWSRRTCAGCCRAGWTCRTGWSGGPGRPRRGRRFRRPG